MYCVELAEIIRVIPEMIAEISQLTEVLGVLAEPSLMRPLRRNIVLRRNGTETAFHKLRKEVRGLLPTLETTLDILRLELISPAASTLQQMRDTTWSLVDALGSLRSLLDTPQFPLHGTYYLLRRVFRYRLRDLCFLFRELHRYFRFFVVLGLWWGHVLTSVSFSDLRMVLDVRPCEMTCEGVDAGQMKIMI